MNKFLISEYFDRDWNYHKWFGSKNYTAEVWTYFGSKYKESNWTLNVHSGPSKHNNLEPWTLMSQWYMSTSTDGQVKEVGDYIYYNPDGTKVNCEVIYKPNNSIVFGPSGGLGVGEGVGGLLEHSGGCGFNQGFCYSKIQSHHDTWTIPKMDHAGWSTPEVDFKDVILLVNYQAFCEPPGILNNSNTWNIYKTDFVLAKDFGVIQMYFYPNLYRIPKWTFDTPFNSVVKDIYYIRLICNENTKVCKIASQYPNF